jgi:NADH-quinone oxidoreductase subunit L
VDQLAEVIWLVIALPLAGAVILHFLGRRIGEPRAGWLASLLMLAAFVVAAVATVPFVEGDHEAIHVVELWDWMPAIGASFEVLWDPLSATMTLIVTGVGTLIHVYSIGYMHGDERFGRFFTYLNLFAASMLTLVLANNFAMLFLGWEAVGLCSYLLISFWFTRPSAAAAGKKAFIVNRIGDFGFMVGLMIVFTSFGTLSFSGIFERVPEVLTTGTATAIGLLFLVGAAGKSAQIPLYVWLPDAMEGPTPVSALIHAATMVTAGVYVVARSAAFYDIAPVAAGTVATIGALTALLAASIAVAQNDIKRVLAYSTISQLGYMFVAVGTAAYAAGIFHLMTHAFFKALLFLGAGSVIHAMAGEQDMRKMGGLFRKMPITAGTMAVATLAIAGVPPLAGFWSKDEVLAAVFERGNYFAILWVIGLVTALLTGFYMTRQFVMIFLGKPRWEEGVEPHESPGSMTVPLVVLGVLSVAGGLINTPFRKTLEHFLEAGFETVTQTHGPESTFVVIVLAAISVLAGLVGIAMAWVLYQGPADVRERMLGRVSGPLQAAERGYGVDDLYGRVLVLPGKALAGVAAFFVDNRIIDGMVNGLGVVVKRVGAALRPLQTGFVRNYALGLLAGAIGLVVLFVARGAF